MTTMQLWTGFIRWATALGRRESRSGAREADKVWPRSGIGSNAYADLDARIDNALADLQQLDRQLSEAALILVEMIDDPRAASARERWKRLTAALAALTTTADELLE